MARTRAGTRKPLGGERPAGGGRLLDTRDKARQAGGWDRGSRWWIVGSGFALVDRVPPGRSRGDEPAPNSVSQSTAQVEGDSWGRDREPWQSYPPPRHHKRMFAGVAAWFDLRRGSPFPLSPSGDAIPGGVIGSPPTVASAGVSWSGTFPGIGAVRMGRDPLRDDKPGAFFAWPTPGRHSAVGRGGILSGWSLWAVCLGDYPPGV